MSDPSPPLVELSKVSHQYAEVRVVNNVSWTIETGDQWVLLGPNGAGKTTLARIAAGYLWPNDGGSIKREGSEDYDLSQWRTRIGWLSSDVRSRIPAHQSVLDTILAGALGQTRLAERRDLQLEASDYRQAEQLLERINLSSRGEQTFSSLSQGETQLILVARALMANPKLITLDEPCAGLDPGARERFLELFERTLDEFPNTATIYITHHVEEVLPLFDHLLSLKAGKKVRDGRPGDLLTDDHLESLYGHSFEIIERNERYWPLPP